MTDIEIFTSVLSGGLLVCSVCIALGVAFALQRLFTPAYSDPTAPERAFVVSLQKDLMKRFPTVADALEAGYRYTHEDASGSIGYADVRWRSADPQHPSRLWYDAHGNLLGADFSVRAVESQTAQSLWGVQTVRWFFGRAHIYYSLEGEDGTVTYGLVPSKKSVVTGGNKANPDSSTLVK